MKTICTNFLFISFLILPIYFLQAQNNTCANEQFQTIQLQNPEFRQQVESIINSNQATNKTTEDVLVIPIAVHVLHLGEDSGVGSNIPDLQIQEAVEKANSLWRNTFVTENSLSNDIKVEFCLAQYDPHGNPSTGIVRADASSIPRYAETGIGYIEAVLQGIFGSDETQTKGFSDWDHNYVLNIWVVHKIAGGWGGYAFFPFGNNYPTDGVVITANSMNKNSTTLAHELGHAMGLFHTFQGAENGCPANDLCFIQGDWICDTPPHRRSDCNNSNCNNSPDSILSFKNLMSYCSNRYIFTKDQKDRIRNTIFNSSRKALLQSTACTGVISGITKNINHNFSIYPNPASTGFTISNRMNKNLPFEIEIRNSLGQTLFSKKLNSGNEQYISFDNKIEKGFHLVLIKNEDKVIDTQTLIIQ
ncbi:MAG: zinc-dependent metalloprotease [Chitinophagales bacterium]